MTLLDAAGANSAPTAKKQPGPVRRKFAQRQRQRAELHELAQSQRRRHRQHGEEQHQQQVHRRIGKQGKGLRPAQPVGELHVHRTDDPELVIDMRQVMGEKRAAPRQGDHPVRAQRMEVRPDYPVMAAGRRRQQRPAIQPEQHCDSRKGPMPFQDWWQRIHAPL